MKSIVTKVSNSFASATDNDGNRTRVHRECGWNHETSHQEAVKALCEKMDWHGKLIGASLLKSGAIVGVLWVWDDPRATRITV